MLWSFAWAIIHFAGPGRKFYGLGEQIRPSTLASIPEAVYRSPDIDKARAAPMADAVRRAA